MLGSSGMAQSLGDVAKREEQRRKTVTKPGKVYTNADLGTEKNAPTPPPPPAPSSSSGAAQPSPSPAPTPAAPGSGASPGATPPAAGDAPVNPKDPESWRKRIAAARDNLSRSQIFAEALQSRINALTADFVNRDDPAQQATIAAERQKALAELTRVRSEIEQQQKAIADIEEEARRAGVPPGVLR
jgi:hypothetical protein